MLGDECLFLVHSLVSRSSLWMVGGMFSGRLGFFGGFIFSLSLSLFLSLSLLRVDRCSGGLD